MAGIEIGFLPPSAAQDAALVAHLVELVNRAHATAEPYLVVPARVAMRRTPLAAT